MSSDTPPSPAPSTSAHQWHHTDWGKLAILVAAIAAFSVVVGGLAVVTGLMSGGTANSRGHGMGMGLRGWDNNDEQWLDQWRSERGWQAEPPEGGTNAAPSTPGMPGMRGRLRDLAPGLANVAHGDFVTTDEAGKAVTMRIVRGAVTAVNPTSVTVKATDGYTATFVMNAATNVSVDGDKSSATDVTVGDTASVVGTVAGKVATAQRVQVTPTDSATTGPTAAPALPTPSASPKTPAPSPKAS